MNNDQPPPPASHGSTTGPPSPAGRATPARVYRSGVTAIAIAWSMRLIGLVSVFVLARLLTPADFGIVALAMATMALLEIFASLGLRQALLRIREPDRSHYDTAWTLQLLLLTVLAAIAAALGPAVAWFYSEPALAWVIVALAARFVILGLVNIGITDFDRHLQLGRDLRMRLAVRLSAFAVTIAVALIVQSYWALVIGALVQSAFHAIASYVAHPFRPRFSIERRGDLLGMSLWMFVANAAQTVQVEIERFVVGRLGSISVVGFYSVSKDLSSIFTQEIATALNRVTFVTTAQSGARLGADPQRIVAMLGTYALLAAPLGLGLAATARNAALVLLGEQWVDAVPFLELIAPAAALFAVYKLVLSSMQASGAARRAAMLAIFGLALIAGGIGATAWQGGTPLDMAASVLAATGLLLVFALLVLARSEALPAAPLVLSVARPFVAALAMTWVVTQISLPSAPPIAELALQVALGALTFFAANTALWFAARRPPGAERIAAQWIAERAATARSRARRGNG